MNIRPLSDRVLVKPLESESITSSGIYIPETSSKDRPFIYEVVAVGEGKKIDGEILSPSVKIGQKVLCGQYAGDDVKLEGNDYKIIGNDYILAVIED